jgi:hypothetical protein
MTIKRIISKPIGVIQVNSRLLHFYRQARQHQAATYGNSGLHVWNEKCGEYVGAREFTGGGAAYQYHALAAYWSARRAVAFRDDLRATVKNNEKRSKAAKRGWKTRRAA